MEITLLQQEGTERVTANAHWGGKISNKPEGGGLRWSLGTFQDLEAAEAAAEKKLKSIPGYQPAVMPVVWAISLNLLSDLPATN